MFYWEIIHQENLKFCELLYYYDVMNKQVWNRIFTDLFFKENMIHVSDNDFIDEKLRMLLNLKIAGLRDENAQKELCELKKEEIKPHQKMIYKQIEEW